MAGHIVLAIVLLCLSGAQDPASPPVDLGAHDTEFTVTTLRSIPLDANYDSFDPDRDWMEKVRIEARVDDPRYVFVSTVADPETRAHPKDIEPHIIAFWSGASFTEILTRRRHVVIDGEWPNSPEYDCIGLFLAADVPALYPKMSLRGTLAAGTIVEQTENEEALTLHLALDPPRRAEVWLTFLKSPNWRVAEMRLELFGPADVKGVRKSRGEVRYHVREWREFNGALVPWIAYRDAVVPEAALSGTAREPYRNRIILDRTRIDLPDRPLGEESLKELYRSFVKGGWSVDDRRARVHYQLGKPEVIVDGYRFATTKPVVRDPVAELPTLLVDAEQLMFTRPLTPVERSVEYRTRAVRGAFLGIAVFSGLVIITWIWRRTMRRAAA